MTWPSPLEPAVVSVQEGFDASTAAGRLRRNMLGAIAEFERETITERTMTGKEQAAQKERFTGGVPAFG